MLLPSHHGLQVSEEKVQVPLIGLYGEGWLIRTLSDASDKAQLFPS